MLIPPKNELSWCGGTTRAGLGLLYTAPDARPGFILSALESSELVNVRSYFFIKA